MVPRAPDTTSVATLRVGVDIQPGSAEEQNELTRAETQPTEKDA